MKIELITDELKSKVKIGVLEVINGTSEVFSCDLLCPNMVVEILEDMGADIDVGDDMDTNGWQWDYWIKFRYNGVSYMISGGGYYGGLRFSVRED